MPSTWSKDFQDILQAKCDAWREAKKGAQREAIVNEVVKAIREQVAENERADPLPSDLAKVSHIGNTYLCISLMSSAENHKLVWQ